MEDSRYAVKALGLWRLQPVFPVAQLLAAADSAELVRRQAAARRAGGTLEQAKEAQVPTRRTRSHLLVATGAAATLLFACGGGSTTEPRATRLVLAYAEPASFPAGGDPGCTHHNAPSFLVVQTDSRSTGRLEPRDGALHSTTLDAHAPGDHWVRVFDYRFCSTGCPIVTSGLSLNGVALHRTAPPDSLSSCPVVWFHVGPNGAISP